MAVTKDTVAVFPGIDLDGDPEAHHGIKNRTHGVGERPSMLHRLRLFGGIASSEKPHPVGFKLHLSEGFAVRNSGGPPSRFPRSLSDLGRLFASHVFSVGLVSCFNKQVAKGRMRPHPRPAAPKPPSE